MAQFKTVGAVKEATPDQLENTPGVGTRPHRSSTHIFTHKTLSVIAARCQLSRKGRAFCIQMQ